MVTGRAFNLPRQQAVNREETSTSFPELGCNRTALIQRRCRRAFLPGGGGDGSVPSAQRVMASFIAFVSAARAKVS